MDKSSKIKINLSKDSAKFSALRTLLSAIRTSIVCLSLAFALLKADKKAGVDGYVITIIAFSAIILIAGIIWYLVSIKILNKQAETPNDITLDNLKNALSDDD